MDNATPKQMSYLRKLYYKADEIGYESYDMFDDLHAEHLTRNDASTLIDYKTNPTAKQILESQVKQIIKQLGEKI